MPGPEEDKMLTRRVARPMLATWFVAEGVDAFRRPADHMERMRDAWRRLAARIDDMPDVPSNDTLRTVVRVHGAATAVAGLMLALDKAPRLAACTLAVLTLPVAAMDAPVKGRMTPARPQPGPAVRGERTFTRDLSLIGGAVLAGLDREGNPSLGWRVRHARERAATA